MKDRLAQIFAGASRAEWTERLQFLDCCYSEVLSMDEAPDNQHNQSRSSYVEADGLVQPRPAPRFVDSATVLPTMWRENSDRDGILREIGMPEGDPSIASEEMTNRKLRRSGSQGQ
jgi:alpha-methylacyl-CoA racemase